MFLFLRPVPFSSVILLCLSVLLLSACGSPMTRYTPTSWWSESSKSSGSFKVGNPYKVDGITYVPRETYDFTQTGIASWYGPDFHGKYTANGETYNQNALTAAHKTLQLPSIVRVTNLENGRSIIVRINDRGPFSRGRIIDMSKRGAELLQFKNQGTAKVKVQLLPEESRLVAAAAKQGRNVAGVEIALNEGKTVQDFFGLPAEPLTKSTELFETMEAQGLLPQDMASLEQQKAAPLLPESSTMQPAQQGQSVPVVDTGMNTRTNQRLAMQDAGAIISEDLPPPPSAAVKQPDQIVAVKGAQPAAMPAAQPQGSSILTPMPGGEPPPLTTAQGQPPPVVSPSVPKPTAEVVRDIVKKVPVTTPANIYVQAGSFGSESNAIAYAQRLENFGASKVYPVSIGEQTFYRVRLGPVETVPQADTILESMAAAGEDQAIIVVGE